MKKLIFALLILTASVSCKKESVEKTAQEQAVKSFTTYALFNSGSDTVSVAIGANAPIIIFQKTYDIECTDNGNHNDPAIRVVYLTASENKPVTIIIYRKAGSEIKKLTASNDSCIIMDIK